MRFISELHGVPADGRMSLHRKLAHGIRRTLGVRPMLTLESQYSFAYPATVDARWRRVVRQIALPQSRLGAQ
jgi:hypothetical protein